jgi:hypothetical protein
MCSCLHGNAIDNADWPFNYIDWEKAADALEDDYNSIEIDGAPNTCILRLTKETQ